MESTAESACPARAPGRSEEVAARRNGRSRTSGEVILGMGLSANSWLRVLPRGCLNTKRPSSRSSETAVTHIGGLEVLVEEETEVLSVKTTASSRCTATRAMQANYALAVTLFQSKSANACEGRERGDMALRLIHCEEAEDGSLAVKVIICHFDWDESRQIASIHPHRTIRETVSRRWYAIWSKKISDRVPANIFFAVTRRIRSYSLGSNRNRSRGGISP